MTNIGRNEDCPCGSGKKYKNCCLNKQPRENAIVWEMDEPTKINSFEISNNGEIKLIDDNGEVIPKNIFQQTSYKRKNDKPNKVLNQIPLGESKYGIEINELSKFDIIFAVDTNTKNLGSKKVSITSRQCCENEKVENNNLLFKFYPFGLACISGIPDKCEEKYGIKLLITEIIANPKFNKGMKIGIVVDHDLVNINEYNSKELPIYKDWYLPDDFILIYASADAGKEYLPNILISACDKEANKFFEEVKKGNIAINEFKDI